jgi:epoxyqueuosine reductase
LPAGGHLAEELLRIGREAGLDVVGICDAGPFTTTKSDIEQRTSSGLAAGMQFTFRNPRRSTDPQATLAGARSLYVGARFYARRRPADQSEGPRPAGRVARYSWVDHYRPLRESLAVVEARLRRDGWRARVLADDNALVDRAAAVRAGLGWYGKNANVLVPGAGSWFVIGSVLTDAPIAPARRPIPVRDGCGPCQRCMRDCPTGALVAPGRLDARRCLAWLLQARGVFPLEHRVDLGDRLYGCDECQERCPVNARASRVGPPGEAEHGAQARVDVIDLLDSSDESLMQTLGRWYVPGREARSLRRNALVVLANTADRDDPEALRVLATALVHPDPVVRAHAVWAARRLGRPEMLGVVASDADPLVRAELDAEVTPR